jgi:hypothetical protein
LALAIPATAAVPNAFANWGIAFYTVVDSCFALVHALKLPHLAGAAHQAADLQVSQFLLRTPAYGAPR